MYFSRGHHASNEHAGGHDLDTPAARGAARRVAIVWASSLSLLIAIAVIWLLVTSMLSRRVVSVEGRIQDRADRYYEAQGQLASLRARLLLESSYERAAIMHPDHDTISAHKEHADTLANDLVSEVEHYASLWGTTEEVKVIADLKEQVAGFRAAVQTLEDSRAGEPENWSQVVGQAMFPRRQSVFDATDELQALNRKAYVRGQEELRAALIRTTVAERRASAVALAMGLGVAFSASAYARRLERRLVLAGLQDAAREHKLHSLSMRLANARDEERRVIARELHDEVGQGLAAIKVEIAAAEKAIEQGRPSEGLVRARAIADVAMRNVRDLSSLFRPPVLEERGLSDALEAYVREFGRRQGIRTHYVSEGRIDSAAPEVERAVYRTVQEALTNVARHANANACGVHLRGAPGHLALEVSDDGVGFDAGVQVASDADGGRGLEGMRDRIEALGGQFLVTSHLGAGTTVSVEVPTEA